MGSSNSKDSGLKKRGAGEDVTRVSSGFRSENSEFTWKIENFDVVRQSKDAICAQKFELQVGEKIGLPCKFVCYLHYVDDAENVDETVDDAGKNWIGIYYNLVHAPEGVTNVNTQMQVEIFNKFGQRVVNFNGKVESTDELSVLHGGGIADLINKQGWGFSHVVSQDVRVDQLPLINGCLVIYIGFTIFAPNPTVTHSGSLLRLRKMETSGPRGMCKSLHNLLKDFGKLLDEDKDGTGEERSLRFSDVKILTRDQQVLKAHKAILSARSPVFEAMFRNDMLESQTGVIRVDDLSSATMKTLLQFIYTGTLPHNWFRAEVVVELTNAAAKYEMKDLLEFLDGHLGSVCDEQTAGKLLLLASRLRLEKAEKNILEYIKQHGVSKSKDFLSIVKNIAATPEDPK